MFQSNSATGYLTFLEKWVFVSTNKFLHLHYVKSASYHTLIHSDITFAKFCICQKPGHSACKSRATAIPLWVIWPHME